jgi:hypothetical protein
MATESPAVTGRQTLFSNLLLLGPWRAKAGALIAAAIQFWVVGGHAEDCAGVALKFLRNHDVPCQPPLEIDRSSLDYVVTCDDGRRWVLLWLENEVAYVEPQNGALYRWLPEISVSYPNLYGGLPREPARPLAFPAPSIDDSIDGFRRF